MKYETPELTALTAINAVQFTSPNGKGTKAIDHSQLVNDATSAYADWE